MPRSSSPTPASEALYDLALAAARGAVVVGTAKNVGKTTTFNALRAIAQRRGTPVAVTSFGRDGEPYDAVDGAPKPRVRLEPGTVVALPSGLLPDTPALEIAGLGEWTPLGRMVFARVVLPTACEIGGPPTRRAMRQTIARLRDMAPRAAILVDGAIDRVALLAGGDEAVVVATGAANGTSVAEVAQAAGEAIARLGLRGREPGRERARVITIGGALDARTAEVLVAAPPDATVVVRDPTRVVVRGALFERLVRTVDLRCEHPLRIVAVTTCSIASDVTLDPRALVEHVARATGLPAFDVLAGLAA